MATAYHLMPVQKIVNEPYQGTIDETALQNDKGGLGGNQADGDALNLVIQWAANRFLSAFGSSTGNLHDMSSALTCRSPAATPKTTRRSARSWTATGTLRPTWRSRWRWSTPPSRSVSLTSWATESGAGTPMRSAAARPVGARIRTGPTTSDSFEPTTAFANGHTGTWSKITSPAAGSYGINPSWRVASSSGPGPLLTFPNTDFDYMSYCGVLHEANPTETAPGTVWTSARGWQQEYRCMSNEANPPAGCPVNEQQPSAGKVPVAATALVAAGAVSGAANDMESADRRSHSRATCYPAAQLLPPSVMPSWGRRRTARVGVHRDPGNQPERVVATEPLTTQSMQFDAYPGHPAVPLIALQGAIPTHGQAIAGLVVRSGGQVTARVTAPGQTPRVTVGVPRLIRRTRFLHVRWNSHDSSKSCRTVFFAVSTTRLATPRSGRVRPCPRKDLAGPVAPRRADPAAGSRHRWLSVHAWRGRGRSGQSARPDIAQRYIAGLVTAGSATGSRSSLPSNRRPTPRATSRPLGLRVACCLRTRPQVIPDHSISPSKG